jgi:stage II sporulation protein AB (anti-sigma F factor)
MNFMNEKNTMRLEFPAKSCNEGFARMAVAAFVAYLDPYVEEVEDIKTAVSEAVTNSIIHGYEGTGGMIVIECEADDKGHIDITITDSGKGIEDIELARQPLYTSKPDMERSGMGFTLMESFMDSLKVFSEVGRGTRVVMGKKVGK